MNVVREFMAAQSDVGCIRQFGHVSNRNYFYRWSVEESVKEET